MSANLFSTSIDVLTKSLTFSEERHRIIANNIANAGTPNFRAKRAPVAEFQKALAAAVEKRRTNPAGPLRLSGSSNIREDRNGLSIKPLSDAAGGILKHDGNNVDLETEISRLAENTLMHGVMSHLLRKQFAMLASAISGRVE